MLLIIFKQVVHKKETDEKIIRKALLDAIINKIFKNHNKVKLYGFNL